MRTIKEIAKGLKNGSIRYSHGYNQPKEVKLDSETQADREKLIEEISDRLLEKLKKTSE